jgi:alpha-2-macroglobulin
MDSAKTDPDLGTYWAREDRSWLWYNDTIETQAFALRTISELAPKDTRQDGLVQWLFLNKKLNQWKSTKATAEVIASVAHYLKAQGALSAREAVSVSVGNQAVTFTFEPDRYTGKKNQVVIPGDKIDPKTSSAVVVEKQGPGLAFASATWHFSTEQLPTEERGDFFSLSRRYFKREPTPRGFVLKPLAPGAALAIGDEVEVQISIKSKHAAEYVQLRDPRAAGLEPGAVLSRYKWDLGISWYEEIRDSGTNFFFEQLPTGEYTFKYRLRANMAGTFKVAPATLQSMYAPEFTAYSAGDVVTVR